MFKTEAYSDVRELDDLLGPVAHSIAALLADLDRNEDPHMQQLRAALL